MVTMGSLVVLAAAFLGYFLLITFLMNRVDLDSTANFVGLVRMGYSITWLTFGLFIYRTKVHDWLKACILAGALAAFMIGMGVQLYQSPLLGSLIALMTVGISAFLLHRTRQKWYHYIAIVLAVIAAVIYL